MIRRLLLGAMLAFALEPATGAELCVYDRHDRANLGPWDGRPFGHTADEYIITNCEGRTP